MSAAASPPHSLNAPPSLKPKRGLFSRFSGDPNAIWMREMRQSARLGRTPWILFALALIISLLMCSVGGVAATENASPASLGGGLFQGFFSIAYFVVIVVGPAIAANSIASEREGKTWEAVQLTGLHAKDIARGKFMAAYTSIALYIVVLAPVGALPFLFGGVTAGEVVVAFAFLFVVAALAVAFGLALSSLMSSLRGAIVITLILAIIVGPALYGLFGFGASFAVHKQWNDVPEGFPVWLPLAYTRAPFGIEYVLVLFALPMLLMLVPAWFLYEITTANLTGETDDRATGLKRWFTLATPPVAAACALPCVISESDGDRVGWSIVGLSTFVLYAAFCALLFAYDTAGPSRRVEVHWTRERAGIFRKFWGPGLAKTSTLVTVIGFGSIVAITAFDMGVITLAPLPPPLGYPGSTRSDHLAQVFVFGAYSAMFFVFTAGLVSWLRSRGSSPWVARLIALAIIFLIGAGPWVVAAIGGVVSSHDDAWLLVAAPSPFYSYLMVSWLDRISPEAIPVVPAGLACALFWGVLGLGLLAATAGRCSRVVREHRNLVAQTDAALRAEDAAAEAARVTAIAQAAASANAAEAAKVAEAAPTTEVMPQDSAPKPEGPDPGPVPGAT